MTCGWGAFLEERLLAGKVILLTQWLPVGPSNTVHQTRSQEQHPLCPELLRPCSGLSTAICWVRWRKWYRMPPVVPSAPKIKLASLLVIVLVKWTGGFISERKPEPELPIKRWANGHQRPVGHISAAKPHHFLISETRTKLINGNKNSHFLADVYIALPGLSDSSSAPRYWTWVWGWGGGGRILTDTGSLGKSISAWWYMATNGAQKQVKQTSGRKTRRKDIVWFPLVNREETGKCLMTTVKWARSIDFSALLRD